METELQIDIALSGAIWGISYPNANPNPYQALILLKNSKYHREYNTLRNYFTVQNINHM